MVYRMVTLLVTSNPKPPQILHFALPYISSVLMPSVLWRLLVPA